MHGSCIDKQFVDINVKVDGKKSSFSVSDIMDVQVESFINPVTGEEQNTKIQLPKDLSGSLRKQQNKDNEYHYSNFEF
jgi:hypothetical protein